MKLFLFITIFLFSAFCLAQEKWTFDQVIDEVLEKDFGVKISRIDAEIAENNNNPGAAGYLPTINAFADQNFSISSARQEFLSGQVNEAENAQNRSFDMGVELNWTFFDGFKMFATDKKLNHLEEFSQMSLLAEMEMKIYEASVAFYTLLALQQMDSVYNEAIDLSKSRLNYIQVQIDNGAASKAQLAQATLDLISDSAAYIDNQRAVSEVSTTLNTLLARESNDIIRLSGELDPEVTKVTWEELIQSAKEQNTSILQSKSMIAISSMEEKEAKSRFYPQLSFYSSYNFGSSVNEVGFLSSNRSFGPSFGITAQWSILDQLSRVTETNNAKLNKESAEIVAKQEELIVEKSLYDAFNAYEFVTKKINFENRNAKQTEEIVSITEKAYEAGSINPFELREIQYGVIEAKGRLIQAQLEYLTSKMNISLLTGDFKDLLN
ncbi:MAG: TolC family protein [Brumimicrobium sp.]